MFFGNSIIRFFNISWLNCEEYGKNQYSNLGYKLENVNKPFFYFSITVATAPIFDYLLEFQIDFKEH